MHPFFFFFSPLPFFSLCDSLHLTRSIDCLSEMLDVHIVHPKLNQQVISHAQEVGSTNILFLELVDDVPTKHFLRQELTNIGS
jgi:hypothetical protein